ncbi:MAG TPA: hypothetical protein ENG98_01695, partial [Actinobacteria bacterium]|nr:hypothetical protein [Actinomycetota bacterium]
MSLTRRLQTLKPYQPVGQVARVTAQEIEVRGLRVRVGESMAIIGDTGSRYGEVVALAPDGATIMLFGDAGGIGKGDIVRHAEG